MWDAFDDDTSGLDDSGRDGSGGWNGQGVMVKWRYVPSRSPEARRRIKDQVRYIGRDGAGDGGAPALFTEEADGVDAATARALLAENRGRVVAFHRYIASPSKGLGLVTVADMRAWVRATMDAYGAHLGRELVYVAGIHMDTRHPHAHILIAGKGRVTTPRVRPRCTHKDVYIKEPDHEAFKRLGIDAARPIADARAIAEKAARKQRAAEERAALYEELGIA